MTREEEDLVIMGMHACFSPGDPFDECMREALRVARAAVLAEAMRVSMAVAFAEETGQRFVSAATGFDVGYANHITYLLERLSKEAF